MTLLPTSCPGFGCSKSSIMLAVFAVKHIETGIGCMMDEGVELLLDKDGRHVSRDDPRFVEMWEDELNLSRW